MTATTERFSFTEIETDTEPIPTDTLSSDTYDEPNTAFVKKTRKPRNALTYQRKAEGILNLALRLTADKPATVADAAAIIQYGGPVAERIGILATHDDKVAAALDWIDGGTENPYLATILVAAPLILQVIRNHEPVLEPAQRGLRIPFLKDKNGIPRRINLPIKIGVRLGALRNATHDPEQLSYSVFGNPEVKAKMEKEDIKVSLYDRRK